MSDRRLLLLTGARLTLCTAAALAPLLITVPSQHQLVTVAYFLPLLFGVLGAGGLRESTQ